jgi:anti-sigma factor RsiW
MMKNSAKHPRGQLAAYADKALEPVEAKGVSEHLLDCTACRAEVREWKRLYGSLARLPRPVPAAGLRDRIVFAVSREALVHRRRASSLGRRAVAALSWAYGSGLGLAAGVAASLIFVPEIRVWAASSVTWASSTGLQAGLFVIDASSQALAWMADTGQSLLEKIGWLETVFRALGTAGEVTELRIAMFLALLLTALIYPILILGRQPRRSSEREGSHVASLIV